MTKHLFFCVLACLFFLSCELPEKQTTSQQIEKIAKLQKRAKTMINDSSLIRLNLAGRLINDLENVSDSLFIENVFLKGYCFSRRNKIDSATIYLHKVFRLLDSSNTSKRDLVYFRYASDYDFDNEKYTNAISKGNMYLKMLSPTKDHYKKVYVFNLFERVYIQLKDYEQALHYNQKCIEAADASHNIEMYAISQISRAKYLYNYFNQADRAYKLLENMIQSKKDLSVDSKLQLQYELGNLKFRDKLFREAIQNYENTLAYIKESNQTSRYSEERCKSFINISEAYTYLKKEPLAKVYLDSASKLVYGEKLSAFYVDLAKQRMRIKNINSGRIDASLADIDSIESYSNRAYIKRMKEELEALKSSNEREKYLTEQKQAIEINNLKLKSRNLMLVVLVISTLLIGYVIYRQRKFKFEKQSLQMQQRLLRSQMNPHFISNTLYAIQNTIKKDQEGSVNYLTKFSRLLRLILENSLKNYVALEKEIESLKKYMDLQLLRFPDKFSYSINLNDIDADIVVIPPMLLQPFIENSIEHGFFGINYKGAIKIMLSQHSKYYLSCIIEDNGIGLTRSNKVNKQSVSLALISDFILKATKTKISIFDKGSVNAQESGTHIEFLIPYKLLEND